MNEFIPISPEVDRIAKIIVNGAYQIHKKLGPGLLESVYEICLCQELKKARIPFETQVAVPITYDDVRIDAGFRLDILVADEVIVELRSVENMNPIFEAQLLTYLKLTGKRPGLLINFNVPVIRKGIRRISI